MEALATVETRPPRRKFSKPPVKVACLSWYEPYSRPMRIDKLLTQEQHQPHIANPLRRPESMHELHHQEYQLLLRPQPPGRTTELPESQAQKGASTGIGAGSPSARARASHTG